MSYAPDYTPGTSFADDETNNVAGRSLVKTDRLDLELADISASINALNANQQSLQRDDGKLADSLVEPYALAEQTRALIASGGIPKGEWAQNTYYSVGDAIQINNVAYLCVTAHNSGSAFVPNLWLAISGDGSSLNNAQAAAASAAAALISQNAAGASAASASSSATSALASKNAASTSETNSGNSASSASISATNAANSAIIASNAASAAANAPVAAPTHAAISKANPDDADEIPLIDSAASFGLKRLTWANLKAALKTYFDTLYNKVVVKNATNDSTFSSTSSTDSVSPEWVRGAYPIRTYITAWSAPYTPAFGENLFAAHGKSSVPNGARLILECVSADLGYAVGERYVPTGQWNGTATPPLAGGYCDATNCGVRCPSGYLVYIANKSTGIAVTPAASKWKYAFEYTI